MSENCTHDCSSCSANCSSRNTIQKEPQNKLSNIKKVIGVVSGKGGVGKSLVTSALAVSTARKGFSTAIMDADITGPSIPKVFGIRERAMANEDGLLPCKSKGGIPIMSINLLLDDVSAPVVWRGPVVAGVVKQFWTDVVWGDVDYMFIDMPPGTGDVPLTVFQSIPLDGIVIVTSPQDLVSLVVEKAVNMAKLMNIPILGLVENYSYFKCPDCGKEISIFGESHINEIAEKYNLKVLHKIPIDPQLAKACDEGDIESYDKPWLNDFANILNG